MIVFFLFHFVAALLTGLLPMLATVVHSCREQALPPSLLPETSSPPAVGMWQTRSSPLEERTAVVQAG
jgi:hypothetical protein